MALGRGLTSRGRKASQENGGANGKFVDWDSETGRESEKGAVEEEQR